MFFAIPGIDVDGAIRMHEFAHDLTTDTATRSEILGVRDAAERNDGVFTVALRISGIEGHPLCAACRGERRVFNIESRNISPVASHDDGPDPEVGIRNDRLLLSFQQLFFQSFQIRIEIMRESVEKLVLKRKHRFTLLCRLVVVSKDVEKTMNEKEAELTRIGVRELSSLALGDFRANRYRPQIDKRQLLHGRFLVGERQDIRFLIDATVSLVERLLLFHGKQ